MATDLRALRLKRGLKLNEAAKAMGMSQTILRMIEDGPIKPTAHELRIILAAYAPPEASRAPAKLDAHQGDLFSGGGAP